MRNSIITFVLLLVVTLALAHPTTAHAEVKTPSAKLALLTVNSQDIELKEHRVKILQSYLEDHNSPMSDSARTFVEQAETNDLDWKLVASIAGVESSYGLHIPANSYNGWGFGVYGNNVLRFASWDDAIVTISETLRTKYVGTGTPNVYAIGRKYAADPNWSSKVLHFMNEITTYEKNYTDKRLSISI